MDAIAPSATTEKAHQHLLSAIGNLLGNESTSHALLLVQVADLPELHARLGFDASATLMQSLKDQFSTALAGRGTVIRFLDGSFCVLVQGIRNAGHAVLAAERLARAIDEVMTARGLLTLSAQIGIALHPHHGSSPSELLRSAQLAATASRRRNVRFLTYDEGCAAEVLQQWAMSDAFAHALEAGEVSMYYQPKVRIADSRTIGAEALMRWLKDGHPVATPDVFIPLAEASGLTQNTTWYALSNALRQCTDLGGVRVAVNISPAMLHHREFLDMVQSAIVSWQTKPGHLTLEVTEGALIADFDTAIGRLSKVRDLGVRIAIDDFGTGYSSLSYFKKIPADELKIDKSFVDGMLNDPADRRLVETIVTLARQFNLDTVAEGVEDQATLEALAAAGCQYAQGHLFAPALSFEDFKAWLLKT